MYFAKCVPQNVKSSVLKFRGDSLLFRGDGGES